MRTIPLLLGTALLAGCGAPIPNHFAAPAPAQAMSCVTEELGTRGYRQVSEAPNGFARMERMNDEPWWLEVMGYNDTADVVEVNSTAGQLELSVYSQVLDGEERSAAAPSGDVRYEVNEIFSECT